MSTPADTPPPEGAGTESVIDLHRKLMTELNDASMTFDGSQPDDEPDSVQSLLSMLAREQAEPRDGFEPVPFWVACVFGALLAWGGYYVGTNSADFRADVFDRSDLSTPGGGAAVASAPDPDPQTVKELSDIGQQKFTVCAACHGTDGKGDSAKGIPPLDGSEWVVGKEASAARLSRILVYGLIGPIEVKGKVYSGQMPHQGNVMKDYEIAGVLTYIRNSWSNKADPDNARPAITAATVRAARAKEGKRKPDGSESIKGAEELLRLPIDYSDTGPPPKAEEKKDKN